MPPRGRGRVKAEMDRCRYLQVRSSVWGSRSGMALLSLLLATTGCFHYTPVPLSRLPEGGEVRVRLSERGATRLGGGEGNQLAHLDRTVEGDLVRVNGEILMVAVPVAARHAAPFARSPAMYRRVAIPLEDVLAVELRELDRKKTGIVLAGAGAAVFAFVLYHFGGEFGGTTKPPPDPGPGEMTGSSLQFHR